MRLILSTILNFRDDCSAASIHAKTLNYVMLYYQKLSEQPRNRGRKWICSYLHCKIYETFITKYLNKKNHLTQKTVLKNNQERFLDVIHFAKWSLRKRFNGGHID